MVHNQINHPEALKLALQHHQEDRLDEAESIYRQILKQDPNHSNTLYYLATLAHQKGHHQTAVELVTKAVSNNGKEPKYYFLLGRIFHTLSLLNDAIKSYLKGIELNPEYTDAYCDLGVLYMEKSQLDKALQYFRQALCCNPDLIEAHLNLGSITYRQGSTENAITHFRKVLELKPDYAPAYYNLGIAYNTLGKTQVAIKHYRHALLLDPEYTEVYNNLANLLQSEGLMEEAIKNLNQALAIQNRTSPVNHHSKSQVNNPTETYLNLGNALKDLGQHEAALEHYQKVLELKPDYTEAHSNLLFEWSYNVLRSPQEMLKESQRWNRIHGKHGEAHLFSHSASGNPNKRLRIGYVSPDLRNHAVSYFLEPILAEHDRTQVEVFCYAEVKRPDAVTQRIQTQIDTWRSTVGISDEDLAHLINKDHIDILIDLAGHTAGNRLKVFTYKPAPIQATYIGYCATTGLTTMDYWITDETLHPQNTPGQGTGTVELATESIYRLPRCWLSYRPADCAPPVAATDHDKPITFGSLNQQSKLTPAVIACWSRILASIPQSRLTLKTRTLADPAARAQLLACFAEHNIAPQRLTLLPRSKPYLETYHNIDIALDSFPRTGGATTADALWMGVPVITLSGERFIERQGVSMLTAMGLTELIADSQEDYVSKAVALAKNPQQLTKLRLSLRQRMATSPLGDARSLAQALESAYRDMWLKYLNPVKPQAAR